LIMAAAAMALWWMGPEWRVWSAVAVLPLTVVGFALAHAYAAQTGKGVTWLTLIYVVWIVLDPAKWIWVACVVIDAFVNFRAKWSAKTGTGSKDV
jgi:uncharacterized protein YybS (DUF2232 family)